MAIVGDIMHRIGEGARKDARAMLIPALLALAGGVTGVAALGFLVASAYVALGAVLGYGLAALLTGSGLALLSLGLVVLARRQMSQKRPAVPPGEVPAAQERAASDTASQIAFTTAFVLARYLGGDRRG
jgi:uncharacterized membrane protein YdjX (TVP38/TMEM64 family)